MNSLHAQPQCVNFTRKRIVLIGEERVSPLPLAVALCGREAVLHLQHHRTGWYQAVCAGCMCMSPVRWLVHGKARLTAGPLSGHIPVELSI